MFVPYPLELTGHPIELQIFESNYSLAAQTDRHLKLLAIVVRVLVTLYSTT